jgi:hypothetical protein
MESTWWEIAIGLVIILIPVALLGLFLYATIIRSKDWNNPDVARGLGIGIIGLVIIGIAAIARNSEVGEWIDYVNYLGIGIVVVGIVWFFYGMGKH